MYKHEIKVVFEDGDFLYTTINGSKEHVRSYYIGKFFNCGTLAEINAVVKTMIMRIEEDFAI